MRKPNQFENIDIYSMTNSVDSDQLASKPADRVPHCFPYNMLIQPLNENTQRINHFKQYECNYSLFVFDHFCKFKYV